MFNDWKYKFCLNKIEKLEQKIMFLEQKLNPKVQELLNEGKSLGISIQHHNYNNFGINWIPNNYSVDDLTQHINNIKAAKFDERRKKGKRKNKVKIDL